MFKSEFNESLIQFDLLRSTNKIVFEFSVNTEEKDTFLKWINILSSVEFRVDVDLDNIDIKEYSNTILFRVRASAIEEDLNRWVDNLKCVSKFLRGEYDITYLKSLKKISEGDE